LKNREEKKIKKQNLKVEKGKDNAIYSK
jgi:hypothetical protein